MAAQKDQVQAIASMDQEAQAALNDMRHEWLANKEDFSMKMFTAVMQAVRIFEGREDLRFLYVMAALGFRMLAEKIVEWENDDGN